VLEMKIIFNTGFWTDIKRDNENDIIVSGSDNNGNQFEIGFEDKFPETIWFRVFIEDAIKLMSDSDKSKILKMLNKDLTEDKK